MWPSPSSENGVPQYADLTTPEFERLAAQWQEVAKQRIDEIVKSVPRASDYTSAFDKGSGMLRLISSNGWSVQAPAVVLGRYAAVPRRWEWGWAMAGADHPAAPEANAVRTFGEQHGFSLLTTPMVQGLWMDAQKLAAVAMAATGMHGIASVTTEGHTIIVFGFNEFHIVTERPSAEAQGDMVREAAARDDGKRPLALHKALLRYLTHPAALMRGAPKPLGTQLVALGPEDDVRLPRMLLEYLEASERALVNRGYAMPLRAARITPTINSCVSLLECPADPAICFVMIAVGSRRGAGITATFETRFADGRRLSTSNSRSVLRTPRLPNMDVVRFTDITDVGKLCDIHRARVSHRARRVKAVPTTRGPDPIAFLDAEARTSQAYWIARGYYREISGGRLVHTYRGATLAAWRGLFPWREITEWRTARKARLVAEELGL